MRILVTGGAGFIGSNLAKHFAAEHQTAVADDFSSANWKNLTGFRGQILTTDLLDDTKSLERSGPFDVISHQASITDTTVLDQKKMMRNNVEAFRNILDLASLWKSRVVWASSCSIYGQGPVPMKESQEPDPLNVYAFSKLAMERLALSYRDRLAHPIVGLRYSNVYGPGEAHKGKFASMIYQLAKQMRAGKRPRIFTDGEQKRDFVYITDILQINQKAMDSKTSGVFNAGSGMAFSFNQLIAELNRVLKTKLPPEYFENPYGFTQNWTETDLSESKRALNYSPEYDLAKGIAAYFESGQLGT